MRLLDTEGEEARRKVGTEKQGTMRILRGKKRDRIPNDSSGLLRQRHACQCFSSACIGTAHNFPQLGLSKASFSESQS
jgi:hypothetical protein